MLCLSTETSGLIPEEQSMYVYVCRYLHIHMFLYVYSYIHMCVSVYIYVYKCMCINAKIHTQAYVICSLKSQSTLISLYLYKHTFMCRLNAWTPPIRDYKQKRFWAGY